MIEIQTVFSSVTYVKYNSLYEFCPAVETFQVLELTWNWETVYKLELYVGFKADKRWDCPQN